MSSDLFGNLRGQLTLELLILFAVFLALLGLWVPVLTEIKKNTEQVISNLQLDSTLNSIIVSADELCVLGPGNIRVFSFSFLKEVSLSASGHNLELSQIDLNQKTSGLTKCILISNDLKAISSKLIIENTNGKIRLSNSK